MLQFDRGYGGIIIRPRVDGIEFSPIKVIRNANDSTIPSDKNDSWWTLEHSVKLVVRSFEAQADYKSIAVMIDAQIIIENFIIKSGAQSSTNFTGLRSWQSGTTFHQLVVETLVEKELENENPQIIGLQFIETSRRSAGRSVNVQVLGDVYIEYEDGTLVLIESIVLTLNKNHERRVFVVEADGASYFVTVN